MVRWWYDGGKREGWWKQGLDWDMEKTEKGNDMVSFIANISENQPLDKKGRIHVGGLQKEKIHMEQPTTVVRKVWQMSFS